MMDGQAGFRTLGPHVEALRSALQKAVRAYRRAEKGRSPEAIAAADAAVAQCFKTLLESTVAGVLAGMSVRVPRGRTPAA